MKAKKTGAIYEYLRQIGIEDTLIASTSHSEEISEKPFEYVLQRLDSIETKIESKLSELQKATKYLAIAETLDNSLDGMTKYPFKLQSSNYLRNNLKDNKTDIISRTYPEIIIERDEDKKH